MALTCVPSTEASLGRRKAISALSLDPNNRIS